ncbi:MAG: GTPase ObgE [Pseudomonadota bacterium]
MKFLDEAKIFIKAGDGGKGRVSFAPRLGGPDGGEGGKGGDIIFKASGRKNTLIDFKFHTKYVAKNGGAGGANNRTGANAEDLIINVPAGTVVKDAETGKILADLNEKNKEVIILEGGKGGKGNLFFATPSRQAPDCCQPGVKGEGKWVLIELKLLADVGIVGLPNAGKSTLISRISAAKPKIADYPFTTLVPNLGVVKYGDIDFVVADMPGLIEDAHKGTGLGIKFLKHIERTKILIHLVDVSSVEGDPISDIQTISKELKSFSKEIGKKPVLYVLSKIDASTEKRIKEVGDYLSLHDKEWCAISSVTGKGLKVLLSKIVKVLEKHV